MREAANEIVDVKECPGILIISHGDMAIGVHQSAQMIFGPQQNFVALGLQESDEPEAFGQKIGEWIERFEGQCIVFVDLMGGTPYNQLCMYAALNQKEIFAVAGMNLPMIIEVMGQRSTKTCAELLDVALTMGKESVVDVAALFK